IGLIFKDMYLDMARTVPVGEVSREARRLIRVTKKAGKLALKKIRPGGTLGDIGNTIERLAKDQGYGIAQGLCGHGIGRELHEEPKVFNEGKRHAGLKLKEGMVICVEPMFAEGSGELEKMEDGSGFKTKDGSLSAHFEDTIAVTADGCEVLTRIRSGE
ncbi:MAG: M24 family metallopeptidase, partial [Candidatus Pacearchaeota archaeon]|nr:M24 family metallopeptidase [Candidatus Pacearchaeota archaeon]